VDNLRDAIFAADVLKRHGLKSAKQVEDWLLQQNELLAQKYEAADEESLGPSVPKTALAKAKKQRFFLGLESTWLYN
jgi:hypothetical protein